MSARARIAALLFCMSAWATWIVWPAAAKPPDLPVQVTVKCSAAAEEAPAPAAAAHDGTAEQAGKLYREGEAYLRSGFPVSACFCYEQVRRLSPTGRYGRMAAARLRQLGVEIDAREERESDHEGGGEESAAPRGMHDDSVGDLLELPALPPVDPMLLAGLDKLLREAGEATAEYTLHIIEESAKPPLAADGTQRRPGAVIPLLTIETPPALLYLSGSGPVDPAWLSPTASGSELGRLLRQAADSVRRAACTEIDASRPGRIRARCSLQVGGLALSLEVDAAGCGCSTLSLLVEQIAQGSSTLNECPRP